MIPYRKYRTGLTFRDVRHMLDVESRSYNARTGQYMFVGRSTVLGRWRQMKRSMYDAYAEHARKAAEASRRARAEGLPF